MFVREDQYRIDIKSDDNKREGMVLIKLSGKSITGRLLCQGNTRLRVEVDVIYGKVAYQRSQFEGGTDLTPPA